MERDYLFGNHWFYPGGFVSDIDGGQTLELINGETQKIEVFHIALGDKSVCGVIACMH
jgi:hypothetical protein